MILVCSRTKHLCSRLVLAPHRAHLTFGTCMGVCVAAVHFNRSVLKMWPQPGVGQNRTFFGIWIVVLHRFVFSCDHCRFVEVGFFFDPLKAQAETRWIQWHRFHVRAAGDIPVVGVVGDGEFRRSWPKIHKNSDALCCLHAQWFLLVWPVTTKKKKNPANNMLHYVQHFLSWQPLFLPADRVGNSFTLIRKAKTAYWYLIPPDTLRHAREYTYVFISFTQKVMSREKKKCLTKQEMHGKVKADRTCAPYK